MPKVFNSVSQRWEHARSYQDQGGAWVEVMRGDQYNAAQLTSAFDHAAGTYIGKGTVLQRDVSAMPVHPDSAKMSKFMWDWSPFWPVGAWGSRTSLNTSAWGTQPIHMHVVDSTHPDCNFQNLDAVIAGNAYPAEEKLYMKGKFPFPSWATGARNGDYGCSIYDLGTGIMREIFMFGRKTDAQGQEIPGQWGGGGGYSLNTPGLKNLAQDNYALQQRRGLSNVAGMHNSLGFIGIAEALNRKIEHALCFTFGAAWTLPRTYPELMAERKAILDAGGSMPAGWPSVHQYGSRVSWPARGADGKAEHYIPESTHVLRSGQSKTFTAAEPHITPTHGQWGRLPDSVDPWFNPRTGSPYFPMTRLIIEAAKKYGVVGTDTNLFCNAFNAEQGRTWEHMYGEDPWKAGGIIDRHLRDPGDATNGGGIRVDDFPWDLVEWAPIDWGRPSPDWNIRPGDRNPWWSSSDPRRPAGTSAY